MFFFFLMIRRPPRSTRTDTLLPYTTLFRSDFLTKPVRDQTLLDAVTAGLERDIAERASAEVVQQHVERFATLTPRESQRSEEHTSELQSLMRISYAVFCLKKKNNMKLPKRRTNYYVPYTRGMFMLKLT